ncbi:MAG: hypothetical protein JNK14_13450 [Chitinophagaceae bacterium]|nr:hypothetical protein [Chitinophagaceae bacterium]
MKLIETVHIGYAKLFSLAIEHEGYEVTAEQPDNDDPGDDPQAVTQSHVLDSLDIEPDKTTMELLLNHTIAVKTGNNSVQCFIRCTEDNKPYIGLADSARLRFLIKAASDFFSKTNVQVTGSEQVYLFSNRDNNGSNGLLSKNETVSDDDLKGTAEAVPDEKCFGIIDLYNSGTTDDYRLLDSSGVINSRQYRLKFEEK